MEQLVKQAHSTLCAMRYAGMISSVVFAVENEAGQVKTFAMPIGSHTLDLASECAAHLFWWKHVKRYAMSIETYHCAVDTAAQAAEVVSNFDAKNFKESVMTILVDKDGVKDGVFSVLEDGVFLEPVKSENNLYGGPFSDLLDFEKYELADEKLEFICEQTFGKRDDLFDNGTVTRSMQVKTEGTLH